MKEYCIIADERTNNKLILIIFVPLLKQEFKKNYKYVLVE